ncbi:hypothetical protein K8T06_11355 [bacterium]|nr:hypothetical protein [bacterium]
MTNLRPVTVYLMGLDPLSCLTPMDGVIRALRRLNWPITIVGVSTNSHSSGNILSTMFNDLIILRSVGEEQFHELVTRTTKVTGPKLLIPMGQKEALAMAPHRMWLIESGFFCPGLSPAQASKPEFETMDYLEQRYVSTVKWRPIVPGMELGFVEFGFPLIMTTPDRVQRWVIPSLQALRVMVDRCFKKGQAPMIRKMGSESVYQVATVMDYQWKPVGWAMAREIARSRNVEPWMFLSVQSAKLQKTAEEVVAALEYQGPVTMRFVYSNDQKSYKLDSFTPVLPVWIDLAAHCGVNLPGRLLENILQMFITRIPWAASPGNMITFNSFDISIPSDTWLNIAGRGGY